MAERFRSALTQNDLVSAATVAVVTGQYNKIGERVIQAGELLCPGYAEQSGQENSQGRLFMDFRDNGASPGLLINGTIRLAIYSPQNRLLKIVGEWRTETLRAGAGDRTKQIPFPIDNGAWASEDKKFVLEYMPDAAQTVGKVNTQIIFDTTEEAV